MAYLWRPCFTEDELDLDGDCVPRVHILQTALLLTVLVSIFVFLFLRVIYVKWVNVIESLTLIIFDVGIATALTGFAISNL